MTSTCRFCPISSLTHPLSHMYRYLRTELLPVFYVLQFPLPPAQAGSACTACLYLLVMCWS